MYIEWIKHIRDNEDEKKRFQDSVYGSKHVLERLKAILEEKEQLLDRDELDISVFNNSNWAYRQAFKNGQRNTLDFLKKLVDLDKQMVPKERNDR